MLSIFSMLSIHSFSLFIFSHSLVPPSSNLWGFELFFCLSIAKTRTLYNGKWIKYAENMSLTHLLFFEAPLLGFYGMALAN
jgi:hypothetical protein